MPKNQALNSGGAEQDQLTSSPARASRVRPSRTASNLSYSLASSRAVAEVEAARAWPGVAPGGVAAQPPAGRGRSRAAPAACGSRAVTTIRSTQSWARAQAAVSAALPTVVVGGAAEGDALAERAPGRGGRGGPPRPARAAADAGDQQHGRPPFAPGGAARSRSARRRRSARRCRRPAGPARPSGCTDVRVEAREANAPQPRQPSRVASGQASGAPGHGRRRSHRRTVPCAVSQPIPRRPTAGLAARSRAAAAWRRARPGPSGAGWPVNGAARAVSTDRTRSAKAAPIAAPPAASSVTRPAKRDAI